MRVTFSKGWSYHATNKWWSCDDDIANDSDSGYVSWFECWLIILFKERSNCWKCRSTMLSNVTVNMSSGEGLPAAPFPLTSCVLSSVLSPSTAVLELPPCLTVSKLRFLCVCWDNSSVELSSLSSVLRGGGRESSPWEVGCSVLSDCSGKKEYI